MNYDQAKRCPRVLLITDVTMPGGVGTHIGQLALAGQKRGWDVSVLMDNGSGSDIMAGSLMKLGIWVRRAGLYRKHHSPQAIIESVREAFESDRPDVVHVHCGSPRSSVLPRELAVETSLPLIVSEHFVSDDLEISEDTMPRLRRLYQQSFAVISVCDENRIILQEKFKLEAKRHVVIRYGVDLLPARSWHAVEGNIKALTVARLSRQKGIDVLIRAVAQLPSALRTQFRLAILGSGELESELRGLTAELCVENVIVFKGWSDDVQAHLRTHDLFILPSIAEGQPISLLEALAAGLPCIASAVSGIPEALGGGKYGALVSTNNPDPLSQAIVAFAKQPIILRRKAAAARLHLQRNHDIERNTGEIIDLWQTAI